MPQKVNLDILKNSILLKFGIKHLNPSDCREISLSIQKETHKNISETTLKRLFGFAKASTRFSLYTINTLTEYTEKVKSNTNPPIKLNSNAAKNLLKLKNATTKASTDEVIVIKNNLTVPFVTTINRTYLDYDFRALYEGNFNFYAVIAQPSFGKTTSLAHLFDYINNENQIFEKDILFFTHARDMISTNDYVDSIEKRIKQKLNIAEEIDFKELLKKLNSDLGTKFIIIIDGISDICSSNTKVIVFDKLNSFLSSFNETSYIKIIFSIRTLHWNRFFLQFKNATQVIKNWYCGAYYNNKDFTNIPQFSSAEVDEIFSKIGFNEKNIEGLKEKLKYPPYLQWYYLLRENFRNPEDFSEIIPFEIATRFLRERIYSTPYATEKITFCRKITRFCDFRKEDKSIPKLLLLKDLGVFKNAYQQLLMEGILVEEQYLQDDFIIERVKFIHHHIFEYFLFIEIFESNESIIDNNYVDHLKTLDIDQNTLFQLLLWSTRSLINQSKFADLQLILDFDLNANQKSYLTYFIVQLIKYKNGTKKIFNNPEEEASFHDLIINYITHFDFADSIYNKAIDSLVSISNIPKHILLYQSILGVIDSLKINENSLHQRILTLKKYQEEAENWVINPISILTSIHHEISNTKANNTKDFTSIYAFSSIGKDLNEFSSTKNILCFLMAIAHNMLNKKNAENITMVENLSKDYPLFLTTKNKHSPLILAVLNFSNCLHPTTSDQHKLFEFSPNNTEKTTTVFTDIINLFTNSHQKAQENLFTEAIESAEACFAICERNHFTFGKILTCELLIKLFGEIGYTDKRNEWVEQKLKTALHKNVKLPSISI